MKNSKQPINPTTYTRVGNNEDDFEPLINGKKTGYEKQFGGLTKREHFAGLAMQSFIINSELVFKIQEKSGAKGLTTDFDKILALASITIADELLLQLEKNK